MWKCLGYRRAEGAEEWRADDCFPKWRERFPAPPDLVGVTRQYSKDIDGPVLKANQALVRTVPMEHKQVRSAPLVFNLTLGSVRVPLVVTSLPYRIG